MWMLRNNCLKKWHRNLKFSSITNCNSQVKTTFNLINNSKQIMIKVVLVVLVWCSKMVCKFKLNKKMIWNKMVFKNKQTLKNNNFCFNRMMFNKIH